VFFVEILKKRTSCNTDINAPDVVVFPKCRSPGGAVGESFGESKTYTFHNSRFSKLVDRIADIPIKMRV